ncbi:MAG: hypothetical protein AB1418_05285 [Pseudomonadota bacterium]
MKSMPEEATRFAQIVFTASLLFTPSAWAMNNDVRVPNAAELNLLPPYCPHTQIISTYYGRQQAPTKYDAHVKPYVDLYGADFWHLHHYCFGLVAVSRAYRQTDVSARRGQLMRSVSEFDYVIRAVTPGSNILPEVHMQKGISLIRMQRGAEGAAELKKSIQLNPHFVRPYIELSDYYVDSKRKDLALQVLEDGLSVSPETSSLQRRYAELGGTKTFVRAPAPSGEVVTTEEPRSTSEAIQPQHAEPAAEAPPRPAEQIGTPTNPYCRFCP